MSGSPTNIDSFRTWLSENGAYLHPNVRFQPVFSGLSVIASEDIAQDTIIVSCPFSSAVTPELSRAALEEILKIEDFPGWSERQLICAYICMHWVCEGESFSTVLTHGPYLASLPSPEKLCTPLHFTEAELLAFKGTNLYGATLTRRNDWQIEWEQCRAVVSAVNASWGSVFTWERYLTASTYLSSRAFPSTILSPTPTILSSPSAYPVLLPGIDALNHARAHPVSWVVFVPPSSAHTPTPPDLASFRSTVSLVQRAHTRAGSELLNNYGPKPNAELILGYGFALAHNPDDTIALKLGGGGAGVDGRWEVGRAARGAQPVWDAIVAAVREGTDSDADATIEDELCAAETLVEMTQGLLGRLPQNAQEGLRPQVREMFDYYLEGQHDILISLLEFAQQKEQQAVETARDQGITFVDPDGDDDDTDEGE